MSERVVIADIEVGKSFALSIFVLLLKEKNTIFARQYFNAKKVMRIS